jgi:hypothetical protein
MRLGDSPSVLSRGVSYRWRGTTARQGKETRLMALKAPGILIFMLSLVLSLAVLFTRYFGASVPLLTQDATQFYAMWGAYLVLLLGCIMRGL